MYVTIIVDADGAAAYGPHADAEPAAVHTAPDAWQFTLRLCHPALLHQVTRVIGEHKAVAQLDAETASVLTETARQRHSRDAGRQVIGVVFHPSNCLAMAIGPFTPIRAARWWSPWRNRLRRGGTLMAVIPLIPPTAHTEQS